MQPRRKGGKRGRKEIRSIKRKRYNDTFARRYGMTRSAWVTWKQEHTPAEVHARRLKAIS